MFSGCIAKESCFLAFEREIASEVSLKSQNLVQVHFDKGYQCIPLHLLDFGT